MVLAATFMIRGILRGFVAQVLAFLGLLAGLVVGTLVLRWVEGHWLDARPASVFMVLRWIVALFSGLAVASAFDWLGEKLGSGGGKDGPPFWDRALGSVMGVVLGLIAGAIVTLTVFTFAWAAPARAAAREGRTATPLLRGATWALRQGDVRWAPVAGWRTAFERATHASRTARAHR